MLIGGIIGRQSFVLVAVAAALIASLTTFSPAHAAGTGNVRGVVMATDGGGPASGVNVCAVHAIEAPMECDTSATDGTYEIAVAPGTVSFVAEDPDPYGVWVVNKYQGGKTFAVTAGSTRQVDFSMIRGARISGDLKAPGGSTPGRNWLHVRAFPVDSNGVTAVNTNYLSGTNDDGYYQVSKLAPGTYKLLVEDGDPQTNRFATHWYPHATVASKATAITVTAGQWQTSRDMTLDVPGALKMDLLRAGKPTRGYADVIDMDGRVVRNLHADSGDMVAYGLPAANYRVRVGSLLVSYSTMYSYKLASYISVGAGRLTTRTFSLNYPTITATSAPTLKIYPYAVYVRPPTWKVPATYVEYQWYRDGVRILASKWDNHQVRKIDIGHRIQACVVGYRYGYENGRSCSPVTIPKAYKGYTYK